MALETGTYIADLNAANPSGTDPKSQGDDHLRLIKKVLQNSLPGFLGLVLVTGTEAQGVTVNDYTVTVSPAPPVYTTPFIVLFKATHASTGAATVQVNGLGTKPLVAMDGSALQAGDITNGAIVCAFYDGTSYLLCSGNDRSNRGGDIYTGTHDFTGAVTEVAEPAAADNSSKAAPTSYVDRADNLKANLGGATYAGIHDFSSASTKVATATPSTNDTTAASTAFVIAQAFQSALPAQSGATTGMFIRSNGSTAAWANILDLASAKSADYTVVAADIYTSFDLSGARTLSLTAAATLGNGFRFWVRNAGTGAWTIDPNGSETIEGRTTIQLYPGEAFAVICDGVGWRCFGRNKRVYIGSTTVTGTAPSVDVEAQFSDTELVRHYFFIENLGGSSGHSVGVRFKKSAAYQTTGYSGGIIYDSGGAYANATSSSGGYLGFNFPLTASLVLLSALNGEAPALTGTGVFGSSNSPCVINVSQSTTATAVQGVRFYDLSSGTLTSGTVTYWAERA